MRKRGVVLAALIGLTSACAPAGSTSPSVQPAGIGLAMAQVERAPATDADAIAAGEALNAFGIDLYRRLAEEDGNLVFSPASIALALAMARAGARGITAEEMDAVLHDVASDEHPAWLNALDQALADRSGSFPDTRGKPQDVTLRIANTAFAQFDMNLLPGYLEALASRFGSGVQLVDYRAATEEARQLINAWVSERTEERIPELLTPGALDEDSRLTLVNAVYLKAAWQTPFEEQLTADGRFTRADGSTVTVPMMSALETFGYARGDGWQAVELPYIGDSLAMTVIVPDDLASFESSLGTDALASIVGGLEPMSVELTLPRFGIETQAELGSVLAELGMPNAFFDTADFSGITTDYPLAISAVVHQANIDVDESGTEAAAATAVVIRATSAPWVDVKLNVNRPFLFALRDVPTGAILFLGRVTDPSAQ